MRISVNEKAGRFLEKLKSENSDRRLDQAAWANIVSEGLLSLDSSFWSQQIEKHTPESFHLKKALKDPKLSKELAEFIRQRMNGTNAFSNEGKDVGREKVRDPGSRSPSLPENTQGV